MNRPTVLYLPRQLRVDTEKIYTEEELLTQCRYAIILAEPGAGKTALMESLARKSGTTCITARKFRYSSAQAKGTALVIDAFDQLAKTGPSAIDELLGKIATLEPTHVYLASRSSEWDKSMTRAIEDFLGEKPSTVRLCEFDAEEQQTIFNGYVHNEDFSTFQSELARFDLDVLLPNPQFLKLFADAYIESDRHFVDKKSIFAQAIQRLAKETNESVSRTSHEVSTQKKIEMASEVFAKIMLSGSEGICVNESSEDDLNPHLAALLPTANKASVILDTQLFKPGDSENHHHPVHRIVAEYCATVYLISKIMDPKDSLSLERCLSIVAPNTVVRDDLRGLLGWMAALGDKKIQEAIIKLDPYAVLSNGDPSLLEPSSKQLLIRRLKEAEAIDPYFRGADVWRRISTAGFFTTDIVEEIKPILAEHNGHLRNLMLELLVDSPAVTQLEDELSRIVTTPEENETGRKLACRALVSSPEWDSSQVLTELIKEGSASSLELTTHIIKKIEVNSFDRNYLANILRACAGLYPNCIDSDYQTIRDCFFINEFIATLDISTIEQLLDDLSKTLNCNCGKESFRCDCRIGISKIVGMMLDRYFSLVSPPFDPLRIWQWVGNLIFHKRKGIKQSEAVRALQDNKELRQGIIQHVFKKLNNVEEIGKIVREKFGWFAHTGLAFCPEDYVFIVNLAFDTDNIPLWSFFMAYHNYYREKKEQGPDHLRQLMRSQAMKKPDFMRAWFKANKKDEMENKNNKKYIRRTKKLERNLEKNDDVRHKNLEYIQANRAMIEAGRDFDCLQAFAKVALKNPEKLAHQFGDENLVRNALKNCLHFISDKIPTLVQLAELKSRGQTHYSLKILYASCLEIMRHEGNLQAIEPRLLLALRTYLDRSCAEQEAIKAEINRLIFVDDASKKAFLTDFIETQLTLNFPHPSFHLMYSDDTFKSVRAELSVTWLKQYPELPLEPLDRLFNIAAISGERAEINNIISERCEALRSCHPKANEENDVEKRYMFWLLRAFYFLDDIPEIYWNFLTKDKNSILLMINKSSFMLGDLSNWPRLNSIKIERVLNTFIHHWPKVDLPSNWVSDSPNEEKAYRFLKEIIWDIRDDEAKNALPVLNRLLAEHRFGDFHRDLKSIQAKQIKNKVLQDYKPPTPQAMVDFFNKDTVISVEDMRQLIIQELQTYQNKINGGEFNTVDRFYENENHLTENQCRTIIAEHLNETLKPKNIIVTLEHQLKDQKRCDFTIAKMINEKRRLLVVEVKGQWHSQLFTAASTQLQDRYAIHPDAEQQGIYLVLWFGASFEVAGKKCTFENAEKLKSQIEKELPIELNGFISVFVLDLSK